MKAKREPPVSIRIDQEKLALIRRAAELEGKSVGRLIKDAAAIAADKSIQQESERKGSNCNEGGKEKNKDGIIARLFRPKQRSSS